MRDQNKFFTYFIVVLSLMVIILGGFFAVQAASGMDKSGKSQINKKDEYPLRRNATDYQKEVHKELLLAIKEEPQNKLLVSELIAKNFIADYFTWSNKLQFNDVGGLQFIDEAFRKSVYDKSLDTFYHDLAIYLDEGLVKDTLEVEKVRTKASQIRIEMDDKDRQAYLVETSWTYQLSDVLDLSEYQTKTFIKIIEDENGLFSVVEVNGNEEKED